MANPKLHRVVLWLDRWIPDDVGFRGDQISVCRNLIPYGKKDYVFGPQLASADGSNFPPARIEGSLHFHAYTATSTIQRLYYGTTTRLYEHILGTSVTDVSRAALYTTAAVAGAADYGWNFASFGDTLVATNYNDEVQFQSAPGTLFANLITSTFAPRAKLCATIRANLFLANCNLPAPYDLLSAGANPFLLAWSKSDVPSLFGSANIDPQHTGAGYQPLLNDGGPITGLVGGDWGMAFQSHKITRIDGPPYNFLTIVNNDGTTYPRSVVRVGDDIYFWGLNGPSVLRGGQPPVEILGQETYIRYLREYDFFSGASVTPPTGAGQMVGAYSAASRCVFWGLTDASVNYLKRGIAVSIDDNRASIVDGLVTTDASHQTRFFARKPVAGSFQMSLPLGDIHCYVESGGGRFINQFNVDQFNTALPGTIPPRITWPYRVLLDGKQTRIQRARPLLSSNPVRPNDNFINMVITDEAKLDPMGRLALSTKSYGTRDTEGWIAFPDSVMSGLHQVSMEVSGGAIAPAYFTPYGVELEVIEGPEFGA